MPFLDSSKLIIKRHLTTIKMLWASLPYKLWRNSEMCAPSPQTSSHSFNLLSLPCLRLSRFLSNVCSSNSTCFNRLKLWSATTFSLRFPLIVVKVETPNMSKSPLLLLTIMQRWTRAEHQQLRSRYPLDLITRKCTIIKWVFCIIISPTLIQIMRLHTTQLITFLL